MKILVPVMVLAMSGLCFASATNAYVTASGTATGNCPTGTGTAPNLTPTQFNTAANWGAGTGKIGSDTVILACGTFTGTAGQNNLLIFQGSGTSGHPIVFTCDTETNITSPQWGGGSGAPIDVASLSWITLNGTNCTIQNTANGSGLANNTYSTGIWSTGNSNIIIENWTIINICQHTSVTDHTGCVTSGNLPAAIITGGSNITISNNTIHDSAYGILHQAGTTDSGVVINGNSIDRCNQHIAVETASSANSIDGTQIYQNTLTNAVNWDDGVTDTFHHNAVFVFQGSGGTITNTTVRNNSMGGDFGVNDTSYVFFNVNGGTITGTLVYNNLFLNGSATNGPANGFITSLGSSGGAAYNNTIFCNGAGFAAMKIDGTTATIKNNIIANCPKGLSVNSGSTITASDFNVFYSLGGTNPMQYNGTNYASLAAWTIGTGFDTHSVTTNPNLNSNGTLQAGSSAIGAGTNLTSLSITALNSDYAGVSRPSSTAWDIGGYQFQVPPTGSSFGGSLRFGGNVTAQ